ncbi:DNA polymerase III PolC [Clostridium scatologenes]|uniref:DNA polymerase III PolC n=2 Tax=Clostridium scatologenes TaxID=1548 RepID=A0A0E3M4B9_CLOSL|nr:DNA polymerase III PolC [Clostridium scatologenes]
MEDVRKGKGLREEYEKIMKKFNVPSWYIESCKKINYMFPKAHAVAYAISALRIGWFKVYHPLAFYSAYFTIRANDFNTDLLYLKVEQIKLLMKEIKEKRYDNNSKAKDKYNIFQILLEMHARNLNFLPISIYKSDYKKFIVENGAIRPALNYIKGLGTEVAINIVNERKSGKFVSLEDFKSRTRINKSTIEYLQKSGIVEDLPKSNQITFFNLFDNK